MGFIQRPTPEELTVVAWMVIVSLAVMVAVGLWFSFGAGAEQAESARQLRNAGVALGTIAVAVYVLKRGLEWFVTG